MSLPQPFSLLLLFPHDFDRLQADATGLLGWKPSEFWGSTLHDLNLAFDGYNRRVIEEEDRQARLLASLINGFRAAQAKRFRPVKPEHFFKRPVDPAAQRARLKALAKDAEKERGRLREVAKAQVSGAYFRRGGPRRR